MGWGLLKRVQWVEEDLQKLIESWATPAPTTAFAGRPAWLTRMKVTEARKTVRTPFGYCFCPDALAEIDGTLHVVELKCADKGEPLALAEALHHCWFLSSHHANNAAQPHAALLITQPNAWLRASIAQLRAHGLTSGVLRHLEYEAYETTAGETMVWFEDPWAEWDAPSADVPPSSITDAISGMTQWCRDKSGTWFGTAASPITPKRNKPVLWEVPCVLVSSVESRNDACLVWHGGPGTGARTWLWTSTGGSAGTPTLEL